MAAHDLRHLRSVRRTTGRPVDHLGSLAELLRTDRLTECLLGRLGLDQGLSGQASSYVTPETFRIRTAGSPDVILKTIHITREQRFELHPGSQNRFEPRFTTLSLGKTTYDSPFNQRSKPVSGRIGQAVNQIQNHIRGAKLRFRKVSE
jgi:hypothetical protein